MAKNQELETILATKTAKKVSKNCLAYKDFLKENNVDNHKIDFFNLPISDKNNYTNKYPLDKRIYKDKIIADYYMICTSSGSMAKPTIWPRDYNYDKNLEPPHTKFLEDHFSFTRKKTLIVIAFGIGTTQAGMMHVKSSWEGSIHGQISVITPNADAEQTVFLLKELHSYYDQIIAIGYPPIIADFIDLAVKKRLSINKWNLKVVFAGESVSPMWRKEIAQKIGGTNKSVVSFYGTTEAGMIGFETKEINRLINYSLDNEKLRFDLFKTFNLPTIVEVNHLKKFIEIINGEIVITTDQVVPLIRYNLQDRGQILTSKFIQLILNKHKINYHFPPNKKVLIIYGRNLSRNISIEDLQNAYFILNLEKFFHKEFQYFEKMTTKFLDLKINFYAKAEKKILPAKIKIINKDLERVISKLINAQFPIRVNIKVYNQEKRIGYKSGKLRYLSE